MIFKPSISRLFAGIVFLGLSLSARAEMLVSPTHIVMDDENRTATLTLRNPSKGSRTYRLQLEDKRALSGGGYIAVKEGEPWPTAKGMLRYSPRQITVGPSENQTVRFSWRPPANLPDGEYRSHLLLQVIPDLSEPVQTFGTGAPEEGSVGIQVHMQMSFSIPIVVRHNTPPPQVSIADVRVNPVQPGQPLSLSLTLKRSGAASSFGQVIVEMQRNAASPVERIGFAKELSIYPEINERELTIRLRDERIPAGSWVRIAYEGLKEYRGIVWDEKVFRTE